MPGVHASGGESISDVEGAIVVRLARLEISIAKADRDLPPVDAELSLLAQFFDDAEGIENARWPAADARWSFSPESGKMRDPDVITTVDTSRPASEDGSGAETDEDNDRPPIP